MKMTSAIANKAIKSLEEEKSFWKKKENENATYVASINEEPVVPNYDYAEVSKNISDINEKIVKIKHALNLSNTTSEVEVEGEKMSIDTVLIKMAMLNERKALLDRLRKHEEKSRVFDRYGYGKKEAEYEYINYDLEVVKEDYKNVAKKIVAMQLALDIHNQTEMFEVDVEL